jgi:hypothetical protein
VAFQSLYQGFTEGGYGLKFKQQKYLIFRPTLFKESLLMSMEALRFIFPALVCICFVPTQNQMWIRNIKNPGSALLDKIVSPSLLLRGKKLLSI